MLLRAERQGSGCCETTKTASAGQQKSRGHFSQQTELCQLLRTTFCDPIPALQY